MAEFCSVFGDVAALNMRRVLAAGLWVDRVSNGPSI